MCDVVCGGVGDCVSDVVCDDVSDVVSCLVDVCMVE